MIYTLTEFVVDNSDEEFQKQLNIRLASLARDAEIIDVKLSTCSAGADNFIVYSALIIYRLTVSD